MRKSRVKGRLGSNAKIKIRSPEDSEVGDGGRVRSRGSGDFTL